MRCVKAYILISVAFLSANAAMAQMPYSNSIKLHSGGWHMGQINPNIRTSLLGAYYTRKISGKLFACIGYSQWKLWKTNDPSWILESPGSIDTTRGTIVRRQGYKMLDLFGGYSLGLAKQTHVISGSLGVSYCWGENVCVEKRYFTYDHGWMGPNYIDKVSYWGLVPQLSYDYNFLRRRVNVGVDIRCRYYAGMPKQQYDIGIHAGVNF